MHRCIPECSLSIFLEECYLFFFLALAFAFGFAFALAFAFFFAAILFSSQSS
jgi:hypothetical protein